MPFVYVCRAWGAHGPTAAAGLVGPEAGRSSHTDPSSSHKLSAVIPIRTAAAAPNDGDGGRAAFVTFDNRLYDTEGPIT